MLKAWQSRSRPTSMTILALAGALAMVLTLRLGAQVFVGPAPVPGEVAPVPALPTHGAFANPTGRPIGGGEGYGDWMVGGVYVESRLQLLQDLATVPAGTTIFIADHAIIDLTGVWDIPLRAGITLASGRGRNGSLGALLYTTDKSTEKPLFRVIGTGVRITGLRLRGPDTEIEPAGCPDIASDGTDSAFDASAIKVHRENLTGVTVRIDNNEMWGWPHAAVSARNVAGVRVQHNHIHHNRRQMRLDGCRAYGLGYGVVVEHSGHVLVEANLFDHNRHDIASDGRPGTRYEARYNLVLNGAVQHSFDVHGGADRGDGTDIAGTLFNVHHNTFLQANKPAFRIRGVPQIAANVWANEFRHLYAAAAANQVNATGNFYAWDNLIAVNYFPAWFVSFGGDSFWRWRRFDPLAMSEMLFADFDADGTQDAFSASDGRWRISRGARRDWELLNTSSIPLASLRLGDFDGNGRADVFRTNGSQWLVSWNGTSAWSVLNVSSVPLSSLRFADFNGDGRTDVFRADGTRWFVSWGGTTSWSQINTSGFTAGALRFADFDGDSRTDVFRSDGTSWYVSWGGASAWTKLNTSTAPLADLGFGDFDSDGRSDVLYANGSAWYISLGGTSRWRKLNASGLAISSLAIADVNGDGRADILSRQNP